MKFLPAVAVAFLLSQGCRPAKELPVYETVPAFSAVDSQGHKFTRADMAGQVWVVDFIYTTCPAACPMMSHRMQQLRREQGIGPDVRFLSISVDPEHDTPAALAKFASRYGGGNAGWRFLSADATTVHKLAFETFHVGDVLGKIEHSTKFILVDRQGRIRGYYSSLGTEDLTTLRHDLKSLS